MSVKKTLERPTPGSGIDDERAADPASGLFGLSCTPEDARLVIVPVPFEATVSYRAGTAQAPRAILEASHQVDLFDLHTGRPHEAGIGMIDPPEEMVRLAENARRLAWPVVEVGGAETDPTALEPLVQQVDTLCAQMHEWVARQVGEILDTGRIPGVLGGEHGVAFGAIEAVARRRPGLGVLQVDAHADLRHAYEGFTWSHASVMTNVLDRIPEVARLVQVGVRDLCEAEYRRICSDSGRITTWFDPWLQAAKQQGVPWVQIARKIVDELPETVYVSLDIDGLDPSLCPNTGTPVPGGPTFQELVTLLDLLVASGRRIVGFDLTEVAPGPDPDSLDAIVGARVLYKLAGFALLSRSLIAPGPFHRGSSATALTTEERAGPAAPGTPGYLEDTHGWRPDPKAQE